MCRPGPFGNDRLLTPPTLKCFSQSGSELRPGQTLLSTAVIRADGADAGKNYTIRYVDGTLTAEDQPVNSHPVVVKTSTHGTVTALPIRTSKGTTVTLTVKPENGYTLETLTVTDGAGNVLTLTDKGNGSYAFTMPDSTATVTAMFMEDNGVLNFFYDVPNGAYYFGAVRRAAENGITGGVGGGLFGPDRA